MVIGINYLVTDQNYFCNDYSLIEQNLQIGFKNLIGSLCQCGYQYYSYQGGLLRPFRSFYTIDLIGNINENEPFHRNLILKSIAKAWSVFNSTLSTNYINPILSNQFQARIAPLGTVITRVFYILFLNNQLVSCSTQNQPSLQAIQDQFYQAGSDLRIYRFNDTSCKYLLSSLFVKKYPLTPTDRNILQNNLINSLQKYLYSPTSQSGYVTILYLELYRSQAYSYNVSRVYYYVS